VPDLRPQARTPVPSDFEDMLKVYWINLATSTKRAVTMAAKLDALPGVVSLFSKIVMTFLVDGFVPVPPHDLYAPLVRLGREGGGICVAELV